MKQGISKFCSILLIAFMVIMTMTCGATNSFAAREGDTYEFTSSDSKNLADIVRENPDITALELHTSSSNAGNVDFNAPLQSITGVASPWSIRNYQSIGWIDRNNINFKAGINTTVKNIQFTKRCPSDQGAFVTIDKGATVHFVNCTFTNKVENHGTAIFENCTFEDGIHTYGDEDEAASSYTGTTIPPEDDGSSFERAKLPLDLLLHDDSITIISKENISESIEVTACGTDFDLTTREASLSGNSGLTATFSEDNHVTLTGSNPKAGTYTLTIKGGNASGETATKTMTLTVKHPISVRLSGGFRDFAPGEDAAVDGISAATGMGASNSGDSKKITVDVKEGDGDWVSYKDFSLANPDATLTFKSEPAEGGMKGTYLYDSVAISGKLSETVGAYKFIAVVKDGERSGESNPLVYLIHDWNVPFRERVAEASARNESEWMMRPWRMSNTAGTTTIPNNIHIIKGSDESGLYGEIGNTKAFSTDKVIIPSGTNVIIRNMKILRSVDIIVEEGGSLTLDDSVAYGKVIVNGGKFSMAKDGYLIGGLEMNGGIVENAKIRGTYYLTDSTAKYNPAVRNLVTVNGDVTFLGNTTITGSVGGGDTKPGQNGLKVNGTVTIPEGSTLTVHGGGEKTMVFVPNGGHAVVLDNGTITGKGKLIAIGGLGQQGVNRDTEEKLGGDAISGIGTVTVDFLTAVGGDGGVIDPELNISGVLGFGLGGDAISPDVKVLSKELIVKAGRGRTVEKNGANTVAIASNPDILLNDYMSDLKISITPIELTSLSEEQQKKVVKVLKTDEAKVFDVKLFVGDAPLKVTGTPVKVSVLATDLGDLLAKEGLVLYHVDEDGVLDQVDFENSGAKLEFKYDKFSPFVIGTEVQPTSPTGEDNNTTTGEDRNPATAEDSNSNPPADGDNNTNPPSEGNNTNPPAGNGRNAQANSGAENSNATSSTGKAQVASSGETNKVVKSGQEENPNTRSNANPVPFALAGISAGMVILLAQRRLAKK